MDKNIWSNFPEVLYERIMACLPIKNLLRFRLVSKEWNQLVLSSMFQTHRASLSRDFMEHVWLACQSFQNTVSFVVSCTGGFMLIINNRQLYVVQFSKLSTTRIPRLADQDERYRRLVGLVVDERTENFSIFMLCSSRPGFICNETHVHRYDSSKRMWFSCGKQLPVQLPLLFHHRVLPVYGVAQHRDRYLMLLQLYSSYTASAYQVRVYDLNNGTWDALPGKVPLVSRTYPLIFSHKGRLLLATLISVCFLCEYDDESFRWMPVGQVDCFKEIGLEVGRKLESNFVGLLGVYQAAVSHACLQGIGEEHSAKCCGEEWKTILSFTTVVNVPRNGLTSDQLPVAECRNLKKAKIQET